VRARATVTVTVTVTAMGNTGVDVIHKTTSTMSGPVLIEILPLHISIIDIMHLPIDKNFEQGIMSVPAHFSSV